MPMACLTKPRTTKMRVNDVVIKSIAGATASTVKMATIFSEGTISSAPLLSAKLMLKVGTLDSANAHVLVVNSMKVPKMRRDSSLDILASIFTFYP